MIPADNEDPEKVKKNEEEVVEVLKALLSVHPLVYFIPGNVGIKNDINLLYSLILLFLA